MQGESEVGSEDHDHDKSRDGQGDGEGGDDDLFHLSADATLREWMQKAGVNVEEVGTVAWAGWLSMRRSFCLFVCYCVAQLVSCHII